MTQFLIIILVCMSFPLLAVEEKTIHVESSRTSGTWADPAIPEEMNLRRLLDLLSRSQTGEKLIKEARTKAARSGLTLTDVIKVGESSLTDTTLVRKFNPTSPQHVIYETKSVVYLNRNLAWDDALLDLAHELTHYVFRESFNPYHDTFNARDFIKGTIEGTGGEVHAFMTECRVLGELFTRQVSSRTHCQKIQDYSGQLSFNKTVDLFYHIGDYFDSFHKKLEGRSIASAFSQLKGTKINFISSAYGVPYPVAALMEYDLVMGKVCENDKRRLAYMQQGHSPLTTGSRAPASVTPEQEKFLASFEARCSQK